MIKYEFIDGVGKITLNRPEKYHSFVREMALQLQDVLDKCTLHYYKIRPIDSHL